MDDRHMAALAKRAIEGDKESFEKLYAEHARSILFHVRNNIVDKENYSDVAQDVVLAMFERIHNLRNPYAFRGWMHRVIKTVCIDHNRSLLSAREHLSREDDEEALDALLDESLASDPEAVTMAKLEGNLLFAIVNDLPETYREVLSQRFYDDLSYKEIAEAQGISVTNVSTRLQRATEAIRKRVGELGEEYGTLDKDTIMRDAETQQSAQDAADAKTDAASVGEAPLEHTSAEKDAASSDMSFEPGGSLKKSYRDGVAMLIPAQAVSTFISSANTKLIGLGAVAAGSAVAAATAGKFSAKLLAVILSAVVVVGAGTTSVVLIATGGGAATENATTVVESTDYSGTMRLSFVDEKGNDSERNIIEAHLIEEVATAVQIDWKLYRIQADTAEGDEAPPVDGTEVASGSGALVDSTVLANLAPGEYQLVFTLVDANGASAEVKRPFVQTE